MINQEGVIKFSQHHTSAPLPDWAELADLQYWFRRCRELDLIGQHPGRYQGAAYGNISQRAAQGFLSPAARPAGCRRCRPSTLPGCSRST